MNTNNLKIMRIREYTCRILLIYVKDEKKRTTIRFANRDIRTNLIRYDETTLILQKRAFTALAGDKISPQMNLKEQEHWFIAGSQLRYSPQVLEIVAARAVIIFPGRELKVQRGKKNRCKTECKAVSEEYSTLESRHPICNEHKQSFGT